MYKVKLIRKRLPLGIGPTEKQVTGAYTWVRIGRAVKEGAGVGSWHSARGSPDTAAASVAPPRRGVASLVLSILLRGGPDMLRALYILTPRGRMAHSLSLQLGYKPPEGRNLLPAVSGDFIYPASRGQELRVCGSANS